MGCFNEEVIKKEGFDVGVNSHLEKASIVEPILERVYVVIVIEVGDNSSHLAW